MKITPPDPTALVLNEIPVTLIDPPEQPFTEIASPLELLTVMLVEPVPLP
jgi:hypothetical protein